MRELRMPDRVDAVIDPMQASRIDQSLDADARVTEELLQLPDRDDPVLARRKVTEPPPPLMRATYVTAG